MRSLDETALHGYLCFSYVPETLAETGLPFPLPEAGREESLITHLRAAVQGQLSPSTTEVGVYLSGGLDSSLVAALLVEAGIRVRAFTLDFGPPHDAELPFARRVAEHLRIPLQVVPARPDAISRDLEATAHALPLPFGDGVTVPLYLLGKTAKDFVQEVWNGEGGDQLFGGWANKPMITALLYGDDSPEAELREYLATYHRFWEMTDRLYTAPQRQRTAGMDVSTWIRPALNRTAYPELLHRLRAANLLLKGAQNIIPRMQALATCHGLQLKAPLLDTALMNWTFTRPPEAFLAGTCEKFLLKQTAEAFLPPEVVWREKRGMGVPTTDWCLGRGRLARKVAGYLSPRRLKAEGRFDPAFVRRLQKGEDPTPEGTFRKRRVGEKLWTLLMWEVWREVNRLA